LREEIAARRGVDADQIVVTNGAGEANYLAMARALERERGSEILLTDPVYPYYPGKTTMLGGTQRFVATDERGNWILIMSARPRARRRPRSLSIRRTTRLVLSTPRRRCGNSSPSPRRTTPS